MKKNQKAIRRGERASLFAVTLLAGAVVIPSAWGQISYVDQGNTTFTTEGCAPTAVANGLIYLENLNSGTIANLLLNGDGGQTANQLSTDMNTTANGTDPADRDSGLATYLAAQNTPVAIVGGQAPKGLGVTTAGVLQQAVSASYMESKLAAGDAVEIGTYWGPVNEVATTTSQFGNTGNGGHVLTLLAMTGTTSGTISFVDPDQVQSGMVPVNTSWTMVNGFIYISMGIVQDPNHSPAVGNDQDGSGPFASFAISDDVVEAVVPEPSTDIAAAMLVIPFGLNVIRRFKARR